MYGFTRRSTVFILSAALPAAWSCASDSSAPAPQPAPATSSQADQASQLDTPSESNPKPSQASTTPELGSFGIDLSAQNPDVEPGNDFYEFANGTWLKTYQLKPDETRYTAATPLVYRSEERIKAIIEELSDGNAEPGSIEQQVGDYFASFMAVDTLNEQGITPLQDDLAAIDGIANRGGLVDAFGENWRTRVIQPIGFGVSPDRKNPDRMVLTVGHSGLGLPSREYYLEDTERFKTVRAAYEKNIATVLGFTGLTPPEAASAAKKVLALETAIAKEHWTLTELRDVNKTYNPMTVAELFKRYPGYPWQRHFKAAKVDIEGLEQINVVTPDAIAPLAKLVKATPLTTWKPYLKYHLVRGHASFLSKEIDDAVFEFSGKVLSGRTEQRERWKRAVGRVESGFGEALGKIYVERHFSSDSKEKMDKLVANLREALRQRITNLAWMGEETKSQAIAKLEAIRPKIGYPKKWRDFSGITITRDDLLGNFRAVNDYWYNVQLERLGQPTDKDEWNATPQTVNAFYNPLYNEILFPAAILQAPFFDPHADPAVNYGAIGAVIGHEMGHGFDDQGSKFDARGVQRNWWTDEDRERFEERAQALVAQYNAYEPLEGERINGQLTLGENIGDLGGLSMAYHAYKLSLGGKEAPVIDGLTGDQRFFLAWAQVWRGKTRDEAMLAQLKSDIHSPEKFRVNGVVRNMDEWYEAFGIQEDHELYLPPEERVAIW